MFTKVYKEEDVRLRGCSYNVASVYFHLKNKRDYFKSKNNGSCYDLTKCISEYTGIPEVTVKRAIATLKKLGLISTVLKGKVNHYSFPILDAIENNTPIEEVIKNTADLSPSNDEEVEQPQPTRDNTTESLKTTIEEGFITDEDKYGKRVMDFLDEKGTEVFTALNAIVEYYYLENENFKVLAEGANKKINDLAFSFGLGINDIKDLETYCIDYNTNLYNTKLELKYHNMDNLV